MINYSNVQFVKSASKKAERPNEKTLPEVLFVGKSNVGKSSLINALTVKKIAFTSSKPGHTKLLNYFNVDNKFYLVDAPGYGYAKGGVDLDSLFGKMMDDYLKNNDRLKLILLLIDSRRDFSEDDIELINYLNNQTYSLLLVFTKSDKLNQKEKSLLNKRISNIDVDPNITFLTSSLDKTNIDLLKKKIEKSLFS